MVRDLNFNIQFGKDLANCSWLADEQSQVLGRAGKFFHIYVPANASPTQSFPSYPDAVAVLQDFVTFSEVLVQGLPSGFVRTTVTNETGKENVCSSKECSDTASAVKEYMDPEADPCTDFYKFACGGFVKTAIIPKDEKVVTVFTIIEDQILANLRMTLEAKPEPNEPRHVTLVKTLYKSCIDTAAIAKNGPVQLRKHLRSVGGWPVLDGEEFDETKFEWKNVVQKMRKMGAVNDYIVNFKSVLSKKNRTRSDIVLNQMNPAYPREFMLNGFRSKWMITRCREIVNFAVFLGANKTNAKTEIRNALLFESKLAEITLSPRKLRKANRQIRMNIGELKRKYPSIPWNEYFSNYLSPSIRLSDRTVVFVKVPSYYEQLERLMSRTPKRVVVNYLYSRLISDIIFSMGGKSDYDRSVFSSEPEEESGETLRRLNCFDEIYGLLRNGVDAIYVRKYLSKETKRNVTQLATDIRQQLEKTLEQASWMDEKTRSIAVEKAAAITNVIGYPDELLDDEKLEMEYKNLNFTEDDYLGNVMSLLSFSLDNVAEESVKTSDKIELEDYDEATSVNAYYTFSWNVIHVPAGILQGVFFGNERPSYMNYGAIGATIGHEIIHGFDLEGRMYDKDGYWFDWWDSTTEEKFMNRTECMIEQYGNYTVPDLGLKLNGSNTLSENIADNGGLKLAYNAYKSWVERNGEEPKLPGLENYSPEQMFWISYGNSWCSKSKRKGQRKFIKRGEHAPNEFRVNGPISNMPEFAEDFECSKNSELSTGSRISMIPEKRCSVW